MVYFVPNMEQLPNYDANDLLLFAAIADIGSLTGAAQRLDMPKATVSRRLGVLEARLQQKLLVRTTRRLVLTEFGQGFLEHCQRVAEEVAAARDFAHSLEAQPRGRLRVSMPGDFAASLACPIATFSERYAEIQLELDLSARRVDVIGERFDVAVRTGTLPDDATLVARKLTDESFGLYASPIYLATRTAPRTPDGLARHRSVRLLGSRGAPVAWRLLKGKQSWEGLAPGNLALNSLGAIRQVILVGAGIAALRDDFAREDVNAGRLVRVLPDWCLPGVPVWAVMPTRRYLPAKTRAFLDWITEHFARAPQ